MGIYDGLKKRMAERGTGGDLFLKLSDDGDNVVGVFRGEPLLREVFWNGERYEEKQMTHRTHNELLFELHRILWF